MTTTQNKSAQKLQLVGAALLFLSVFGITEIVFYAITTLLLGHPATNTTGRAMVSITTAVSGIAGVLLGITLLIVGTTRGRKT